MSGARGSLKAFRKNSMRELDLHLASEIVDEIEELWVTSDSTVIHLSIDVSQGVLRGFSCRLGPGVVAEMGQSHNVRSGAVYPSLSVFVEDENRDISSRWYCFKRGDEWFVES
jgi:hypothetical protein